MQHIIQTSTKKGQIVLDCFAGSGSTGVACAVTGRRFIGIEKDSEYVDIARRRIESAMLQQRLGVE
jgi:site-specific DNA-methyltransferase (adenine-specific)